MQASHVSTRRYLLSLMTHHTLRIEFMHMDAWEKIEKCDLPQRVSPRVSGREFEEDEGWNHGTDAYDRPRHMTTSQHGLVQEALFYGNSRPHTSLWAALRVPASILSISVFTCTISPSVNLDLTRTDTGCRDTCCLASLCKWFWITTCYVVVAELIQN